MRFLYRLLLRLYPVGFRLEFADEMLSVFDDLVRSACGSSAWSRSHLYVREIRGLLNGAAEERVRQWVCSGLPSDVKERRFAMRNSFRFPKSVAPMMAVVFALVVFTISRASSAAVVAGAPQFTDTLSQRLSLPLSVGLWVGLAYLIGALVWIFLHSIHQSGPQRLSNVQTWPGK